MSDERTFRVAVWCMNCGAEWEVDAPFKAAVEVSFHGVFIHPANCGAASALTCKGYHVECPTCGRTEKVSRR